MGKHNNSEVAKRLRQEIAKATDPHTVIELTKELRKVQPKRHRQRKAVEKPAEIPKKNNRSLREIYTGSVYAGKSDRDLVIHHLVLLIEKKRRELGRKETEAEIEELLQSVNAEGYQECEALNTEKTV